MIYGTTATTTTTTASTTSTESQPSPDKRPVQQLAEVILELRVEMRRADNLMEYLGNKLNNEGTVTEHAERKKIEDLSHQICTITEQIGSLLMTLSSSLASLQLGNSSLEVRFNVQPFIQRHILPPNMQIHVANPNGPSPMPLGTTNPGALPQQPGSQVPQPRVQISVPLFQISQRAPNAQVPANPTPPTATTTPTTPVLNSNNTPAPSATPSTSTAAPNADPNGPTNPAQPPNIFSLVLLFLVK